MSLKLQHFLVDVCSCCYIHYICGQKSLLPLRNIHGGMSLSRSCVLAAVRVVFRRWDGVSWCHPELIMKPSYAEIMQDVVSVCDLLMSWSESYYTSTRERRELGLVTSYKWRFVECTLSDTNLLAMQFMRRDESELLLFFKKSPGLNDRKEPVT